MTTPVRAASAAVFRIGFGVVGLILVLRFFAHGWIEALFIAPEVHFKYPGFAWVEPLPGAGMYFVFALLGLAAASIALGYRHRIGAALFAVGLAYVELIDRTNFLNHYYWMVLTAALLVLLPVGRMWSVDAKQGRVTEAGWVPLWVVWLLRFQVGMVYFFAGLAKLNADWLLRAEPLATWLPTRSDLWLVGPLLALPATAYFLSWAGAFFDLTVVAWLLNRRTRLPAYVVLVAFHTSTWLLFPSIGVFPLVMSLSALVFFDPDWHERLIVARHHPRPGPGRVRAGWVVVAAIYVGIMALIPLRHFAMPGDVRWTAEGYHGSWHVMLTEKTGVVDFVATDDEGRSWVVPPPDYLTPRQLAVMATDPALIQQTARMIAVDLGASVAADARISFNGRPNRQYTDSSVILSGDPVDASRIVTAAP